MRLSLLFFSSALDYIKCSECDNYSVITKFSKPIAKIGYTPATYHFLPTIFK